eukprot:1330408-Amphidinium_carterae.1
MAHDMQQHEVAATTGEIADSIVGTAGGTICLTQNIGTQIVAQKPHNQKGDETFNGYVYLLTFVVCAFSFFGLGDLAGLFVELFSVESLHNA